MVDFFSRKVLGARNGKSKEKNLGTILEKYPCISAIVHKNIGSLGKRVMVKEILFLTPIRIIIDFLHNDEVLEITKRANPGEFFLRYPNNLLGLEVNERNCLALSGLSSSRTEDKFIFPLTTGEFSYEFPVLTCVFLKRLQI